MTEPKMSADIRTCGACGNPTICDHAETYCTRCRALLCVTCRDSGHLCKGNRTIEEVLREALPTEERKRLEQTLRIVELERAVIKAAQEYVSAKRTVRGNEPDPLPPTPEGEPTKLDAFFQAEAVLFSAVDALPEV